MHVSSCSDTKTCVLNHWQLSNNKTNIFYYCVFLSNYCIGSGTKPAQTWNTLLISCSIYVSILTLFSLALFILSARNTAGTDGHVPQANHYWATQQDPLDPVQPVCGTLAMVSALHPQISALTKWTSQKHCGPGWRRVRVSYPLKYGEHNGPKMCIFFSIGKQVWNSLLGS